MEPGAPVRLVRLLFSQRTGDRDMSSWMISETLPRSIRKTFLSC